jgi:hypothetical protein
LVEVKVAKADICFDGSSCGHKQKSKTEKIGFRVLLYTIYDIEKPTGHYRLGCSSLNELRAVESTV